MYFSQVGVKCNPLALMAFDWTWGYFYFTFIGIKGCEESFCAQVCREVEHVLEAPEDLRESSKLSGLSRP